MGSTLTARNRFSFPSKVSERIESRTVDGLQAARCSWSESLASVASNKEEKNLTTWF